MAIALREVQRVLDNAQPPPTNLTPPAVEIHLPFWARWFGLGESIERQLAPLRAWRPTPIFDEEFQRSRQILEALLVGYRMSLQRIERALERLDCRAHEARAGPQAEGGRPRGR